MAKFVLSLVSLLLLSNLALADDTKSAPITAVPTSAKKDFVSKYICHDPAEKQVLTWVFVTEYANNRFVTECSVVDTRGETPTLLYYGEARTFGPPLSCNATSLAGADALRFERLGRLAFKVGRRPLMCKDVTDWPERAVD